MSKKLIYMAHPLAGDPDNISKAKLWLAYLIQKLSDCVVIAPWITECELFDDADPEQRKAGIERCEFVVGYCDGIALVGGHLSDGMSDEMNTALIEQIPVYDLLWLGPDVPVHSGGIETVEIDKLHKSSWGMK